MLRRLSDQVDSTLAAVVPARARVAFINFPNISNVGDLLLWEGTRSALRRLGVRVQYTCEPSTYHPDGIRRMRGACDAILINGGGNFGDLWRGQQAVRERVLADFPTTPVVQLPQSLHFEDRANLARTRQLLTRHDRFTALWRENDSLHFAREHLPGTHHSCPDMAFALRRFPPEAPPPGSGIVWLSRADKESRHPAPTQLPSDVRVLDWLDERAGGAPTLRSRLARAANERFRSHLRRGHRQVASRLNGLTHPTIARQHVRRGVRILRQGNVVITDRLHAHVLALLLGIPHVLLDNSYGKVRATHDTWTGSASLVHWADDAGAALQTAYQILDQRDR